MSTLLYAGPTLARLRQMAEPRLEGIDVRPPIRRGELDRLISSGERAGVAVICDGVFHLGQLAVGHAEIRVALERGWQVWGVSSMGAIRAAEMATLGMRGFGAVFGQYRDDPDFRDDEVTLLHEPVSPYRELSEPLVHLRAAAEDLVERGELQPAARADLIHALMERWFGDRTLPRFHELLIGAGVDRSVADEVIRGFDRYRVKAIDLGDFLRQRPFIERTSRGD